MAGPSILCGTGEVPINFTDLEGARKLNLRREEELWDITTTPHTQLSTSSQLIGNTNLTSSDTDYKQIINIPTAPATGQEKRVLIKAVVANDGCTREIEHEVVQYPKLKKPQLDFLVPPATYPRCAPFTTQLGITNNGDPADQYPATTKFRWRFFDGTEEIPTAGHQFPFSPRTFQNNTNSVTTLVQRLYVSDADGNCKDSADFPIQVAPRLSVNIDLNPAEFCEGQYISINSATQGDDERTWTLYNMSAPTVPLTQYSTNNARLVLPTGLPAGTYKVKLEGKNAYCSESTESTFIVHPQPVIASFDKIVAQAPNCYPFTVQLSSSVNNATHYEWTLRNSPGQTFPAIPLGSGTLAGTATVLNPTFTIENSSTYDEYRHIRLTLTTEHGCSVEREERITVPPNLEVSFFGGDYSGCPDGSGKFAPMIVANVFGASITDENKRWYVDGNEVAPGPNPNIFSHELENTDLSLVKDYIVKYKVTTASGCEKSVEQKVTVYPRLATVSEFSYMRDGLTQVIANGDNLCTPIDAHFTASGAPTLEWTFTDGSQLEGADLTKRLDNKSDVPLPYTVTLRPRNAYCIGVPHVRTFTLLPEIRASFIAEVLDKCNPVKVKVTNTSSPSGLTADWKTIGGVEDAMSPGTYIFSDAGTRSIELRMTNSEGCYADAAPFELQVPPLLRA